MSVSEASTGCREFKKTACFKDPSKFLVQTQRSPPKRDLRSQKLKSIAICSRYSRKKAASHELPFSFS